MPDDHYASSFDSMSTFVAGQRIQLRSVSMIDEPGVGSVVQPCVRGFVRGGSRAIRESPPEDSRR